MYLISKTFAFPDAQNFRDRVGGQIKGKCTSFILSTWWWNYVHLKFMHITSVFYYGSVN